MIHAFHGCELDEELFQLRRGGRVVKLEPRCFDLLLHLIRHRDRVVGKQELLREVWPGTTVTESVLHTSIAAVRRALGDDRGRAGVIQTIHGRGYRFVAPVEQRAAAPAEPSVAAPGARSPFVGREAAMKRLGEALASAQAGRGRLLLVVGEPGIGKTRTTDEFADLARREGAWVYTGRCHEGEGAPVFWPWLRVLREMIHDPGAAQPLPEEGDGAGELGSLLPGLGRAGRGAEAEPSADGDAARFRLFDGVATFLRRASESRALVLVLDDLHWADEASLRLLRFLAAEVCDARILLVATYRDVEVRRGHPLSDVLGDLAREPHCERVPLRGLAPADVARLIEALLGAPAAERLNEAVWEMTDGNPFFVQEVVGLLASEGRVARVAHEQEPALALPQSVRAAIGRRLDALSPGCNRMLRVASVLGRGFRAALLERVGDLPHRDALEGIDEALQAGVLAASDAGLGSYAFRHALVRQTLYDEIEIPERVRLHRRAGEALEEICGGHLGPHLAELAHHFFLAAAGGSSEEAVRYCVLAAERARRSLAYEEAARLFERALQVLELRVPPDPERRCEVLLAHGAACWDAGERDRGHAAFGEAAELARDLGSVELLARAAAGSRLYDMGTPPEGRTRELIEEALAALGEGHPGLRARLLSRLVGIPPYSDSMERRDAWSREALELARSDGGGEPLRDALLARRWACLGPDRIGERFEVARELFALAERSGDLGLAALGQDVLHGAHLIRGEIEQADRALAAYARIARTLRHPVFLHQALVWQGSRELARGAFDDAERLIREAFHHGRRVEAYAHFIFAGQMFTLRSERGESPDSEAERLFFGEMMELPYAWVPAIRSSRAMLHVFAGERDQAQRELDALARGLGELPRDEHWLPTLGTLANLATALGDERHGAVLYQLLEPYGELFLIHDVLRQNGGSVSGVLGSLASMLGRREAAEAHFEDAVARCEAVGAPIRVLATQAGYARHLLRCGRAADRARGERLAARVREGCVRFGIPRSRNVLEQLGELAPRAAHG